MKKSTNTYLVIAAIMASLLGGCGGGGGGGQASYAGQWVFVGRNLINDCNANVPTTETLNWTVNQDGSTVVVNSGQVTLQGSTNDKDGFEVTAYSTNSSNGCETGYGIGFEDASDGEAQAVVALVVKCGNVTCRIGYGGIATRQSTSTSNAAFLEDNTLADLGSSLENPTQDHGLATEGGLENAVEEMLLNNGR